MKKKRNHLLIMKAKKISLTNKEEQKFSIFAVFTKAVNLMRLLA